MFLRAFKSCVTRASNEVNPSMNAGDEGTHDIRGFSADRSQMRLSANSLTHRFPDLQQRCCFFFCEIIGDRFCNAERAIEFAI